MGRNKSELYRIDLHQQAYNKLKSMIAFGESKTEAKANGTYFAHIYSIQSFKTYLKHSMYFIKWINENHPECTTLKAAKRHVNEWLNYRVNYVKKNGEHLSAETIHTEKSSVYKLFQITLEDPNYFSAPKRNKDEITRSRLDVEKDRHFSEKNNGDLIKFCKGTGCRRDVLEKLKGQDLWHISDMKYRRAVLESKKGTLSNDENRELNTLQDALETFPEHEYFIHHRKDKNGKYRFAPVIGPNVDRIVEIMKSTQPDHRVWKKVSSAADVHGFRAVYADIMYKMYERKLEDIPYDRIHPATGRKYRSGVYHCRKDKCGKWLDREALAKCSKALGHNRIEVVARNYLRAI